MLGGAVLVLVFQITGMKPMGLWPGVWGFIVSLTLYIAVSMMTPAPTQKAEEFIHYLREALPKGNFF
jgi:solute:Na+ symporter, SSS family